MYRNYRATKKVFTQGGPKYSSNASPKYFYRQGCFFQRLNFWETWKNKYIPLVWVYLYALLNSRDGLKKYLANQQPNKQANNQKKKMATSRTRFQYRHLNYLALPESINTVLLRRTNLLSIFFFIVVLILEPLSFPSLYNFVDALTHEI